MKRAAKPPSTESPARQLAGFLDKFDPRVAALARACRAAMRKRLPTAHELVYDNYNALAIGYGPTERASDAIVSLPVTPRGVSICFIHGAKLPDPKGILQGSGNQTRFVRLSSAKDLARPELEALLRAAIARAKTPLPAVGRGRLIIKSVSAKQHPRRASKTARTRN
ncbi:MAG TPA: DUF1801 domain-containing protein [Gemmatimonadota bacterium]